MSQTFHTRDWLHLHDLTAARCLAILSSHEAEEAGADTHKEAETGQTPLKAAFELVVESLRDFVPALAGIIGETAERCVVDTQVPSDARPVTLHGEGGAPPTIRTPYQGAPRDVLNLAHEFGHCVQLSMAAPRTPPPVLREMAAFFSERALLEYAARRNPALSEPLREVWREDERAFLGPDKAALLDALRDNTARYDYRWNYPIARILTAELARRPDRSQIVGVFDGRASTADMVARCLAERPHARTANYFPPIPQADPNAKGGAFHKFLGVAAALELDYWQKKSDLTIEQYFSSTLTHFETKTIHFSRDAAQRPVGYLTWSETPDGVVIRNQTAPFGHRRQLLREARRRLEGVEMRGSEHRTSANKSQRPW